MELGEAIYIYIYMREEVMENCHEMPKNNLLWHNNYLYLL